MGFRTIFVDDETKETLDGIREDIMKKFPLLGKKFSPFVASIINVHLLVLLKMWVPAFINPYYVSVFYWFIIMS